MHSLMNSSKISELLDATKGGLLWQYSGRNLTFKDGTCCGFQVLIYYWDERDGPNFHGWWFGPKAFWSLLARTFQVGGDQVWAYNANKLSPVPPASGWKASK